MKKSEIYTIEGIKVTWCTHHKQWEPIKEFGKNKGRKNGLQASCKAARIAQNASDNNRRNMDHWIIYELPNGHIGYTNRPYFRMSDHAHYGRCKDRNDYKVIAIAHSKDEAQILEALYQSLSNNYNKPDWGNQVKQL